MIPIVIDLNMANVFIAKHHRHSVPLKPINVKYIIGLENQHELIGVAILGRPCNRFLEDGATIEIRRLATNGLKNSCSFLLARCSELAFALGYKKIITYTLQIESGSSLKATGFEISHKSNSNGKWRETTQTRLDGREMIPSQKKICWQKLTKWRDKKWQEQEY
jgi:hypothetical protein